MFHFHQCYKNTTQEAKNYFIFIYLIIFITTDMNWFNKTWVHPAWKWCHFYVALPQKIQNLYSISLMVITWLKTVKLVFSFTVALVSFKSCQWKQISTGLFHSKDLDISKQENMCVINKNSQLSPSMFLIWLGTKLTVCCTSRKSFLKKFICACSILLS